MVLASKYGQMEPSMKEPGSTIKPMAKENSGMLTAMSTMVSGKKIKPMAMEYISTLTVQNMKATGKMIYKTAMV